MNHPRKVLSETVNRCIKEGSPVVKEISPNRKLARRVYECTCCGQQIVTTTNHQMECYPTCQGECRHTYQQPGREIVTRRQTVHRYVSEWDGKKAPGLIIVD